MFILLLSQPWTPFQASFYSWTLSHLFHPHSEWVTSHSPAQSGPYELITFSFPSPGKGFDMRTHQNVEQNVAFPPQFELPIGADLHTEVRAELRMWQMKYLSFLKLELHKLLHVTKYAERVPHTVMQKQSWHSVLFGVLPELLLPAYLLKVCAVCALIGGTACSSVM